MINIVCSGIAGCGEKEFFEEFINFCKKKRKNVNVISVTDVVLEVSKKSGIEVNKYSLLNFPKTARSALYNSAFEVIVKEKLKKNAINVINLHFTYWWKNGAEEVVKANILYSFLKKINPVFFLVMSDRVKDIMVRLRKPFDHVGRVMLLEDIMRWQDVEYYVTKIFAEMVRKKIYLFHKEYSPKILYELLFEKKIKAYLSFPMLFLRNRRDKKRVYGFIKEVSKYLIPFIPIEEFYAFEGEERRVKNLNAEMIVRRDLRLIDQSDMVIAFFPKIVHSTGVIFEIQYAYSNGKSVYLIWPSKTYSPFTARYTRKIFFSTKKCLEEIKEISRKFRGSSK